MGILRIISWCCLIFCVVYLFLSSNDGERLFGFLLTALFLTIVIRLHPQPFNRMLRWFREQLNNDI